MRKALAVAVLDLRRRWMPAAAFGVAAGLLPGLARGIAAKVEPTNAISFAFGVAALIAGATFGSDFNEGRSSFFFARPVSTPSIVAGRIAALCGLCVTTFLGFTAAYGLSGRQSLAASLVAITTRHVQIVVGVWIASLFFTLAIAASTRQARRREFVELLAGGVRVAVAVAITALMMGLFVDLAMRAYATTTPIKVLAWSYAGAAFLSALAAIELGRTDRLQIGRVLNIGMYCHTVLAAVVVLIVWVRAPPGSWRDHRPDERLERARRTRGVRLHARRPRRPNDVRAAVQRRTWVRRSTARDGRRGVQWSRISAHLALARRRYQGVERADAPAVSLRTQGLHQCIDLSNPHVLRRSHALRAAGRCRLRLEFPGVQAHRNPPTSAGDLFAVRWIDRTTGHHVAFMSPSRGQLSHVKLPAPQFIRAWAFLESRQLRVVAQHPGTGELQFIDIDPATGSLRTVTALGRAGGPFYQNVTLDASARHALLITIPYPRGLRSRRWLCWGSMHQNRHW